MSEETHKRVYPYPHPKHPTIRVYEDAEAYYGEKWQMYEYSSCCGCCGYFNIFDNSTHKHLASVSYCADYASRYAALERALALLEQEDVTKFTEEERVATK